MNADQLFDTTMDPEKRILVQVRVADAEKADAIFNKLMGSEVEPTQELYSDSCKICKGLGYLNGRRKNQLHQKK